MQAEASINDDQDESSQFHIQTDEGDQRFFKYRTNSGQFRNEERLADGSVVGTYGWVDANGILRLYEYIADQSGYRIVSTQLIDTLRKSQDDKKTVKQLNNNIEDSPKQLFKSPDPLILPSQTSSRLQRRLSSKNGNTFTVNVQPLFNINQDDEQVSSEEINYEEDPFSPGAILKEVHQNQFPGPRLVAKTRAQSGEPGLNPRKIDGLDNRNPTVDYETQKSFHYEREGPTGSRIGQYGYIDPIGVRRVVNYSTGQNGEIIKSKENDFVGTNTYFRAN